MNISHISHTPTIPASLTPTTMHLPEPLISPNNGLLTQTDKLTKQQAQTPNSLSNPLANNNTKAEPVYKLTVSQSDSKLTIAQLEKSLDIIPGTIREYNPRGIKIDSQGYLIPGQVLTMPVGQLRSVYNSDKSEKTIAMANPQKTSTITSQEARDAAMADCCYKLTISGQPVLLSDLNIGTANGLPFEDFIRNNPNVRLYGQDGDILPVEATVYLPKKPVDSGDVNIHNENVLANLKGTHVLLSDNTTITDLIKKLGLSEDILNHPNNKGLKEGVANQRLYIPDPDAPIIEVTQKQEILQPIDMRQFKLNSDIKIDSKAFEQAYLRYINNPPDIIGLDTRRITSHSNNNGLEYNPQGLCMAEQIVYIPKTALIRKSDKSQYTEKPHNQKVTPDQLQETTTTTKIETTYKGKPILTKTAEGEIRINRNMNPEEFARYYKARYPDQQPLDMLKIVLANKEQLVSTEKNNTLLPVKQNKDGDNNDTPLLISDANKDGVPSTREWPAGTVIKIPTDNDELPEPISNTTIETTTPDSQTNTQFKTTIVTVPETTTVVEFLEKWGKLNNVNINIIKVFDHLDNADAKANINAHGEWPAGTQVIIPPEAVTPK